MLTDSLLYINLIKYLFSQLFFGRINWIYTDLSDLIHIFQLKSFKNYKIYHLNVLLYITLHITQNIYLQLIIKISIIDKTRKVKLFLLVEIGQYNNYSCELIYMTYCTIDSNSGVSTINIRKINILSNLKFSCWNTTY